MRALLPSVSLLAAAFALSGCGDSTTSDSTSEASGDHAKVTHLHIDGALRTTDDGFVLTPEGDEEPITFAYGEGVEEAKVRALEATHATARVTFEPTEDEPVASDVRAAPDHEGLDTYEGTVESIEDGTLVIDGDDGRRTFELGMEDERDIEHLGEHADNGSPVRVYLAAGQTDSSTRTVVAYEDA